MCECNDSAQIKTFGPSLLANNFNGLNVPKDMTETGRFAFDVGSQSSNRLGPLCGFRNRVSFPQHTTERQNRDWGAQRSRPPPSGIACYHRSEP